MPRAWSHRPSPSSCRGEHDNNTAIVTGLVRLRHHAPRTVYQPFLVLQTGSRHGCLKIDARKAPNRKYEHTSNRRSGTSKERRHAPNFEPSVTRARVSRIRNTAVVYMIIGDTGYCYTRKKGRCAHACHTRSRERVPMCACVMCIHPSVRRSVPSFSRREKRGFSPLPCESALKRDIFFKIHQDQSRWQLFFQQQCGMCVLSLAIHQCFENGNGSDSGAAGEIGNRASKPRKTSVNTPKDPCALRAQVTQTWCRIDCCDVHHTTTKSCTGPA